MESPEERKKRIQEQQWASAGDIDVILAEITASAASTLPAIGEITQAEFLERVQAVTIKAFTRRRELYL